jgi:hypothetical protein
MARKVKEETNTEYQIDHGGTAYTVKNKAALLADFLSGSG